MARILAPVLLSGFLVACGKKESRPMTEDTFWELIEAAHTRAGGDGEAQAEHLRKALEQFDPKEIIAFDSLWHDQMRKSYSWDLWGAAYIINGGASDDGFEYFRCWLIGKGRKAFHDALRDPETLANVAEGESENESIWYAPQKAYEKVTGKSFPILDRPGYPKEPAGTPWKEEEVDKRYPGLAKRFN